MNRAEYMAATRNDANAHKEYYGQFVDEKVKGLVKSMITKDRIMRSEDPEYFNDIPLYKWDALAGARHIFEMSHDWQPPQDLVNKKCKIEGTDRTSLSLAECVSIYKEAARQIREEE